MYILLTGQQPFKGQNEKDLFAKICRGMYKVPETIDFEAKRLLNKILVIDPNKRPSASDICADRWVNIGRGGAQFKLANLNASKKNIQQFL